MDKIIETKNDQVIENILQLSKKLNMTNQSRLNRIESLFLHNIGFKNFNHKILCFKCRVRGPIRYHIHACTDDKPMQNFSSSLSKCLQTQLINLSQKDSFPVIKCGRQLLDVFYFLSHTESIDSSIMCNCQMKKYCSCFSKHLNVIRKNKFKFHKNCRRNELVQFFKNIQEEAHFKVVTCFENSIKPLNFHFKEFRTIPNFTFYFLFTDISRVNSNKNFQYYNILEENIVKLL